MSKTTEPTPPTAPEPTLEQLFAAWLDEHNAEIVIGVRTPTGDAVVGLANFVPPGWVVIYTPKAKA